MSGEAGSPGLRAGASSVLPWLPLSLRELREVCLGTSLIAMPVADGSHCAAGFPVRRFEGRETS